MMKATEIKSTFTKPIKTESKADALYISPQNWMSVTISGNDFDDVLDLIKKIRIILETDLGYKNA